MDKQAVIQQMEVSNCIVFLPDVQLERKVYTDVASSLQKLGGKWHRKLNGFAFEEDPTQLIEELKGGKQRNLKKEFQFFATPPDLADKLVALLDIRNAPSVVLSHESKTILEPSAGDGAIIKAIHRKHGEFTPIYAVELMELNRKKLKELPNVRLNGKMDDFLDLQETFTFDYIIANPPFTKGQDIEHIQKMYTHLKDGGTLVSVSSNSWLNGNFKKQKDFAEFLGTVNAEIQDVPRGAFKTSGTLVGAKIIIIKK